MSDKEQKEKIDDTPKISVTDAEPKKRNSANRKTRRSKGSIGDTNLEAPERVSNKISPTRKIDPFSNLLDEDDADAKCRRSALRDGDVKKGKSTVIVYHHSMEQVAKEMKDLFPEIFRLVPVSWNTFADGWPNINISTADVNALTKHSVYQVVYLGAFDKPANLFEQFAVIHAIPKFVGVRNFKIICPWFPTGTMERVEHLGEIATARSFANILDRTPMSQSGPATITIFDIHALQSQFYFSDNVLVELKSAIFLLRQHLAERDDHDDIAICFPDDGAAKRFKPKFTEYPLLVCMKVRVGEERVIKVHEGEPEGKHCVIVDDLVQTGGTLISCAKALQAAGAKKISCYVTHAIFPNESWKKFVKAKEEGLIDSFFFVDTIPDTKNLADIEPFKVFSIAPLLCHQLMKYRRD